MYSKNDYRYYLEHRLEESDDYLAHYGVKGMKWRRHLKKTVNSIGEFFHPKPTVTFEEPTVYSNNKLVRNAQKAAHKSDMAQRSQKKKSKFSLKPKNQKVTVITDSKRKRSKKEAAWNNEMKGYAKQVAKEEAKRKKNKEANDVASAMYKVKTSEGYNQLHNQKYIGVNGAVKKAVRKSTSKKKRR